MPLVFVHGVNVRTGTTVDEQEVFNHQVLSRDNFFRTIALAGIVRPPAQLHIENPYWGQYAAHFSQGLASVPGADVETFGAQNDDPMGQILVQTLSPDIAQQFAHGSAINPETGLLLALARSDPRRTLPLAVDAVLAAAALRPSAGRTAAAGDDTGPREVARFAAKAVAYLATEPDLSWLNARRPDTGALRLQDDSQFLEALADQINAFAPVAATHETFGIGGVLETLKGAASALGSAARSAVNAVVNVGKGAIGATVGALAGAAVAGAPGGGIAVRLIRPIATQRAGIFIGDVFTYLSTRGDQQNPGPIAKTVRDALRSGADARKDGDSKLIVIAHSMGGNIVYDILTHFDRSINVDALITVGSQAALFKELKLYMEDRSAPVDGAARPGKPDNVGVWINVFDPLDVLGFAVAGVFDNVSDFAIANQASPLDAHTTYFLRPHFHERLRVRLAESGLGVGA